VLAVGEWEVVVRAWDTAANTQPERAATVWNPKGYVNNSWGRVRLRVSA
jgi:sulfite oxidase